MRQDSTRSIHDFEACIECFCSSQCQNCIFKTGHWIWMQCIFVYRLDIIDPCTCTSFKVLSCAIIGSSTGFIIWPNFPEITRTCLQSGDRQFRLRDNSLYRVDRERCIPCINYQVTIGIRCVFPIQNDIFSPFRFIAIDRERYATVSVTKVVFGTFPVLM